MAGSSVDGRALINDIHKVYVRTYRRNDDGYSGSDESLACWLVDQGYRHMNGWPYGARLRYIPVSKYGDAVPLAPYIDGNHQNVSIDYGQTTMSIDDDGEWLCSNTDGFPSRVDRCQCSGCGDYVDEDDLHSTYEGDGDSVCDGCVDNDYFYVYGRREYQYYVHRDDMVEVNGRYYHDQYLRDNNIVELYNGDYAHLDDTVEIDGDCFLTDDPDVVYCDDAEEYGLRDDCWQCEVTNNWYKNDEPVRLCDIDSQDEIDSYEADLTADETTLIEGV
jgi:hypothetical protein